MTDTPPPILGYLDRRGWEDIWQRPTVPGRFDSYAAPNSTVVQWSATLPTNAYVLDVGCGMGRHSVYLGSHGFRVAGCDVSPTGIEKSVAACAAKEIPFDGRACDMAALPWADETFDAALSTSTIHHHVRAQVQAAIDEVWRVLRPGGLVLFDFPTTSGIDYAENRAEVDAGRYIEFEPNTFIDRAHSANSRDIDGFLPHHFCDEADLRDLVRRFTVRQMNEVMRPARADRAPGMVGKWVVWLEKPSKGS